MLGKGFSITILLVVISLGHCIAQNKANDCQELTLSASISEPNNEVSIKISDLDPRGEYYYIFYTTSGNVINPKRDASNNTISNLAAGIYRCSVFHGRGCQSVIEFKVD